MWKITGVSDNYSTGTGLKTLTIYESSPSVPDPVYGVRSDHFMLITGNSTTFFVEELPRHPIVASDTIRFSGQYLNEILVMTNGSMWKITGVSDNYSTGTGLKSFTIYQSSLSVSDPAYGARSTHFMLVEGNSTTFFVEELPSHPIIITDTIVFSSQYINELFVLTDGSLWVIRGVSDNYSTGSGSKTFTIYQSSHSIPNPAYGVRSDYFMLIINHSTTFFIEPI